MKTQSPARWHVGLFLAAFWLCVTPAAKSQMAAAQYAVSGTTQASNLVGLGVSRVLGTLRSANMNVTTDQSIPISATVTSWAPTSIWVTNCSASMTLAAGGFYPATSKGGTALVAATQLYSGATTSAFVVNATMAAGIATTRYTISTVYFSLTTAQGSASTCDLYVIGVDLT